MHNIGLKNFVLSMIFAFTSNLVFGAVPFLLIPNPYLGPGDLQTTTPVGWWGLRAFSLAKIGSSCVKVRRSSDNTTLDIKTRADGLIDVDAASVFASGSNLFVETLYDQVGSKDMTQATLSMQPRLFLTGGPSASLPYLQFTNSAVSGLENAANLTLSQPLSVSILVRRTGDTSVSSRIFWGNPGPSNNFRFANSSGGGFGMNFGAVLVIAAAENTWLSVQQVASGASSVIRSNGSEVTGNGGTNGFASKTAIGRANGGGSGDSLTGSINEVGLWGSAMTATQRQQLELNQRSFWGF